MSSQLDKNFVVGVDLRGSRMFGGGAIINPEGRFAMAVNEVGWIDAKSGNGKNFTIRGRSIEAGFEGLELTHQVYVDNEALRAGLREVPGMSEETKRNLGMAKDKLFSAFRGLGYTDEQLFSGVVPIGAISVANAPNKTAAGEPVLLIRIVHKLDDVQNPRTKKAILLKNGKPKHRVQQDTVAVNATQYAALPKPDRSVLSEAQKAILIEASLDTGEGEEGVVGGGVEASNVVTGSFGGGEASSFPQGGTGGFGAPSGDAVSVPPAPVAPAPVGGSAPWGAAPQPAPAPAAPAGFQNGAPPAAPWGATGATMPPARA